MKPTHQFKGACHEDVVAWRYLLESFIPVWVARSFHRLGGDQLIHQTGYPVKLGDWIVVVSAGQATVLTDEEFQKCFVELPKIKI